MLRSQVRERVHGFLLGILLVVRLLLVVCRPRGLNLVELFVDCVVCSFKKALVSFTFQNGDAKLLAVRSHLSDIYQYKLNDEINFAGPLEGYVTIDQSVLIGNTKARERRIFKLDIELPVYRCYV